MRSVRGLSLKARIDLLFGLLLFLGLAADIGRMIAEARPRVQVEDEAMTRLARDFVVAALANLQESPDPERGLTQTLASLGPLRHVRIGFAGDAAKAAAGFVGGQSDRGRAPDWFARLIGARPSVTMLPAMAGKRHLGDVVIASDPSDEINEIWAGVSSRALTGGAVALAALLGASFLLGRTLRPLDDYGVALGRMGDGDFAARVIPAGSPEFVDIGARINELATALDQLSGANRQLIQRLMNAQDEERRAIAHELHDEIGPHLFALRANAAVLEAGLRREGAHKPAATARGICDSVEALQGQNRRILRRLWPAALEDLGLGEALRILAQGFRETQPSVAIELDLPDDFDACGPREKLALYRLVQEGLTNAFRHARASHIAIELAFASPREISVAIHDDGVGFPADAPPGLGLTGMRERMRGLGGRFSCAPAPGGGALIEALLPVTGQ
ncbi:ATP-binding protein [Rhodoblastus sp.]|uniref:ATP-binding protein n=1 Tax=Rhodoblastus sp. TaxID=1962975 RepID=UPI003F9E9184